MKRVVLRGVASIVPGVLALLVAMGLAALLAALAGADPGRAIAALFQGALGSAADMAQTLVRTTPLLLTGTGVMLGLRAGIFNVGAEGQFLVGALAATAVGTIGPFGAWQGIAVLAAGILAGGAWALVAGGLRIARGVSEVISTILLNFVALYLVSWAVHGPLGEAAGRYPQSDLLFPSARLPILAEGTQLHAGIPLALGLTVAVGVFLTRTTLGLRMRAAGQNAQAARFAGFPVVRDLAVAFALSGALAGLAGAVEVAGVTGRLYEKISPGYGYAAIAVALLGGLRPVGVILAASFFAALAAGASSMERSAGVSAVVVQAVQGATLLTVAALRTPTIVAWLWAQVVDEDESLDAEAVVASSDSQDVAPPGANQ